jgi:hypothetical protein
MLMPKVKPKGLSVSPSRALALPGMRDSMTDSNNKTTRARVFNCIENRGFADKDIKF